MEAASSNAVAPSPPVAETTIPQRDEKKKEKKRQRCRYFGTAKGCRAGDACEFRHDVSESHATSESNTLEHKQDVAAVATTSSARRSTKDGVTSLRATNGRELGGPGSSNAPVNARPAVRDVRGFQMKQIKTRYSAKEEESENGTQTMLHFKMEPSDPDFPFEISHLQCTLRIPHEFPSKSPTLRITNREMERGFQINVERGFDEIWRQASQPTLLNAMKVLDKQLEALLIAQKAETVTIVANSGVSKSRTSNEPKSSAQAVSNLTKAEPVLQAATHKAVPTASEIQAAQDKRATEVSALSHRFGRIQGFAQNREETLFTLPLTPRKPAELPLGLRDFKSIRLHVPLEYNLEPCWIDLSEFGTEGAVVEAAFIKRVKSHPELSLFAHVNYLAQNLHIMAKPKPQEDVQVVVPGNREVQSQHSEEVAVDQSDRPHLKYITRPPEWDRRPDANSGESSDGETDSDYLGTDSVSEDEEHDANTENAPAAVDAGRESGVMLSFPQLELFGIELLELAVANLSVKCDRCKTVQDATKLRPTNATAASAAADAAVSSAHAPSSFPCRKCAAPLAIAYRADLLHGASTRAGYFDVESCTPVDVQPSLFTPTCAGCSTPYATPPGVMASVGGGADAGLAICRTCYAHMSFRLGPAKLLHVGAASAQGLRAAALPRKQQGVDSAKSLGLVAGQPLPNRGACTHYRKSHRWFRFGCCGRVFACDKCHDASPSARDHPNEFGNMMVCGFCAREQRFHPSTCRFCRRDLTGARRTGFWEGGQGTRDKARMSRKDPRKFKRRGDGARKKEKDKDKGLA